MKTLSRATVIAFVFFTLVTTTCSPAGNGTIAIFVTIAPEEGPLKILGFRLPDKVGDPPTVLLQNTGEKVVRDLTLTALIGSPRQTQAGVEPIAGIGISSGHPAPQQWVAERLIPPGETREVHQSAFRSHNLASFAVHLHSDCAHAAVYISRIEFADGTVWGPDRSSSQTQKVWRDSIQPESTRDCANPPMADYAVDQVKGFGYPTAIGSPSHGSTEVVSHFAFSCPIQNVGGQLIALCPR
jgi:hypothetical protein